MWRQAEAGPAGPARCGLALPRLLRAALALLTTAAAAEPPNILYILCDDLGYGDVRCLNPQRGKIPTPAVDRLAQEGMTFTDAHSGSSVCTPTRYGILTGRYAWRTRLQRGVLDNYAQPLIAAGRLTVPALLQRSGYHTACIGKWHLGFTVSAEGSGADGAARQGGGRGGAPLGARTADGPLTRGFDHFYGFHHARMMRSVFTDDRVTELVEPVDMLPALARRASAYVSERAASGKPFFLYLALNSPHTPIAPSPAWQGKSGLGDYGDFVMETDWAVGEVLAALERAGAASRTLVVFTSDNGCSPAAGVQGLEKLGHYPSAGYRGYKADIWDGGHRVPFIVRWPGQVKPGSACGQLVCLTDLLATCAELVGAQLPADAGEDSVSILPLLKGEVLAARAAAVHHSIDGAFAVRSGEWKLALCPGSGGWGQPRDGEARKQGLPERQLYNLREDPAESRNLLAEQGAETGRLQGLLAEWVARGRSTPGAAQSNDVAVAPAPGAARAEKTNRKKGR